MEPKRRLACDQISSDLTPIYNGEYEVVVLDDRMPVDESSDMVQDLDDEVQEVNVKVIDFVCKYEIKLIAIGSNCPRDIP